MARVDDQRDTSAVEQRLLARGADTTRSDWLGKVTKQSQESWSNAFFNEKELIMVKTYAPVANAATFCLMLALTKAKTLHLDVDSAFPYADLEENVFMT